MFGTPDFTTALVLIGLFVAVLLGLLSYHSPRRNYVSVGLGLLIVATALALLIGSFGQPSLAMAVVLLMVLLAVMAVLLTYQNRRWAHAVWWLGVLLFILALPLLGAGRAGLALFAVIAGPGLLMLVATLYPEVPAMYSRLGVTDAPDQLTPEELATERHRYTRLAGGITLAALAGVWLFGGIPQGPVIEAGGPVEFDEALAQRGAQLFTQYGCTACHSVTGQSGVGPTLQNVYTHEVRLTDGTVVVADEAYLRESIAEPNAKIVNGYSSGTMLGTIQANLSEITQQNNLNALVEYIKSLAAE